MQRTSRRLVAGDVRGRLGRLYRRATTITAVHGPFACIFCVGEFFPEEPSEGQSAQAVEEDGIDIGTYMAGNAKAPIPTYFLAGADKDGLLSSKACWRLSDSRVAGTIGRSVFIVWLTVLIVMDDQQELCHNITYLGKCEYWTAFSR